MNEEVKLAWCRYLILAHYGLIRDMCSVDKPNPLTFLFLAAKDKGLTGTYVNSAAKLYIEIGLWDHSKNKCVSLIDEIHSRYLKQSEGSDYLSIVKLIREST